MEELYEPTVLASGDLHVCDISELTEQFPKFRLGYWNIQSSNEDRRIRRIVVALDR